MANVINTIEKEFNLGTLHCVHIFTALLKTKNEFTK